MTEFREKIQIAVQKTLKDLGAPEIPLPKISIEHPAVESFGDYSTNAAMMSFKTLKAEESPYGAEIGVPNYSVKAGTVEELASKISAELRKDPSLEFISKIEVVPPGFINFWLKPEALVEEINQVGEDYGSSMTGKGETIVVDYSAPNIAKRFGVGHLRSTVIGQALYNLYNFSGYKVVGDNHLGDWGTQFGALLAQIRSAKAKVDKLTVADLEKLYVDFHREAEEDPRRMEEAREWFLKLEQGDKEARELWKEVVEVSKREFDRIYAILGVKFDHAYGESFYEDKMPAVIAEVRKSGLVKKSDGAEIVEFDRLSPAILVKSDGGTTYFTRDLATIKYRLETWKPQMIVYEVGADQKLHFQQVFETAKRLGWADGCELVHVAHGLIRFAEGKMSTRRGQTIKLEEVLDEAVGRAERLTGQKGLVSKAVGIGAVKYFDLSHQPQTDIIFDWEKMFLLEGNSAPYLQYTYARARSVLNKAKTESNILDLRFKILDAELPLLRYLYRFPEIAGSAAKTYSPNLVCNYLFELAQRFNSFYASAPIIKAEENKELRLALTSATAQVLKNGLTILGIETPERL